MSTADEGNSTKRKRRSSGAGMVRHRPDGLWEARCTIGDGQESKRVSRYAKTKDDAEALLKAMHKEDRQKKIEKKTAGMRRKPGTGTVRLREKDGLWEARLFVNQVGGKKPISRYAVSEEEAIAKLEELRAIVAKDPNHFRKYRETRKKGDRSLYFVRAGEYGPIKIGMTTNVKDRVAAMQVGNHLTLNVLFAVPNISFKTEWAVHARFKHCRIAGEWFEPCAELLTFIDEVLRDPGILDIPSQNHYEHPNDAQMNLRRLWSRCRNA